MGVAAQVLHDALGLRVLGVAEVRGEPVYSELNSGTYRFIVRDQESARREGFPSSVVVVLRRLSIWASSAVDSSATGGKGGALGWWICVQQPKPRQQVARSGSVEMQIVLIIDLGQIALTCQLLTAR